METWILKVILAIVMVLLVLLFGLLPLKVLQILRKKAAESMMEDRWPSLTLCLLTCFTGGVFLGTCFLHLLPEVNESFAKVKTLYNWAVDYPIGELVSCVGFFLVFFLEELVLSVLNLGHGHSHSVDREFSQEEVKGPNFDPCLGQDSPQIKAQESVKEMSDAGPLLEKGNSAEPSGSNGTRNRNGSLSKKNSTTSPLTARSVGNRAQRAGSPTELIDLAEPERCEGPCDGLDEHPPILMTSRPHAHSHGVRSVTLLLALSFHSVIEGLAFGIQSSTQDVLTLFLSLIIHKCVVAFSVGLQLARTHAHQLRLVIISIFILALMSPVGCAIGIAVEQSGINEGAKNVVLMVFEGMAVGTFLYVTFFEIFIHERDNEHPNLLKLLLTVLGFALIGCLRIMEHTHNEDNALHTAGNDSDSSGHS